jgi:hypothetical protein
MKTLRCATCDEDIEVADDDLMLTTPGEHGGCGGRLYKVLHVVCKVHGEVEWRGDVMCANCKKVYLCEGIVIDEAGKLKRSYPDAPPKGMCSCGKRLFGGTEFMMRPMCRVCATTSTLADHVEKNGKGP